MKVLLDMDGVVSDFARAAHAALNVPNVYDDPMYWGNWEALSDLYPHIWSLTESKEFWENIPKTPEADELVGLLEGTFGAENIAFFSSPTRNEGCMPGKQAWIRKHFPKYSRRFIFGPPKHFLAHERSLLIDDRSENCSKFFANGGGTILYPTRGNSWAATPWAVNPMPKVREVVAFQKAMYTREGRFGGC